MKNKSILSILLMFLHSPFSYADEKNDDEYVHVSVTGVVTAASCSFEGAASNLSIKNPDLTLDDIKASNNAGVWNMHNREFTFKCPGSGFLMAKVHSDGNACKVVGGKNYFCNEYVGNGSAAGVAMKHNIKWDGGKVKDDEYLLDADTNLVKPEIKVALKDGKAVIKYAGNWIKEYASGASPGLYSGNIKLQVWNY